MSFCLFHIIIFTVTEDLKLECNASYENPYTKLTKADAVGYKVHVMHMFL